MKNSQEFKTNDFYTSCCLLAAGLILERLERGNSKFVVFIFSDPQGKAEQIIRDHWNRRLKLPTRDLVEAVNQLKTRLYSNI